MLRSNYALPRVFKVLKSLTSRSQCFGPIVKVRKSIIITAKAFSGDAAKKRIYKVTLNATLRDLR
jgi:hypothetical protein